MGKLRKQMEPVSAAKVIKQRRLALSTKAGYRSLFLRVLLLALIAYALFTQVFLMMQANGNDMFPAVADGDLLIAFRLQRDYIKNDIVVYTIGGQTKVGRIIAKETDVVAMDDTGSLIVNGTVQSAKTFYPTYATGALKYPYRVPNGSVFVLGDSRTEAKDSRENGPVPLSDVKGKVITLLRRREL